MADKNSGTCQVSKTLGDIRDALHAKLFYPSEALAPWEQMVMIEDALREAVAEERKARAALEKKPWGLSGNVKILPDRDTEKNK